ncbi:MAG: exodeoxyribonuclease VII large subunit [Campylobacter gracilis]|uniref:exodeoxyribonuclease VII large subunit n=1 Tax=Campylobacter gracilis TaxID=824 RepID=UPI0026F3059A|nr:exodeoxyribonuclease VII large subunit [Campylobacter gracilis]MBS6152568.1 exodeoxyribonuclease VII large subunit [Campylobacter gracilis]
MLSVSELNAQAKALLETSFSFVEVEGEISKFRIQSTSGHWYFTIKDASAAIDCAMFKFNAARINFIPAVGDKLIVSGKVSLYAPTGAYQIQVSNIRKSGEGELEAAFAALKQKLSNEGLFDAAHKKQLPKFSQSIAIITSAGSAAQADMLRTAQDRFALCKIDLYNALVQGEGAPASIISALRAADEKGYDAIVIARGGGSREDLWCFNDEALARAIYAAETPVISAVGHEIDFSISDFVADHRSLTPTAAMIDLLPDICAIFQSLDGASDAFDRMIKDKISSAQNVLSLAALQLKSKSVEPKISGSLAKLLNFELKFKSFVDSKLSAAEHTLSAKDELLAQKAKFFEITKNLVQIQKDGKTVALGELAAGDEFVLYSQQLSKNAKII